MRPYWFEDTSLGHGVCVAVCPGESYGYLPDQTCRYLVNNLSTCPATYYADPHSRHCVLLCPNGSYASDLDGYCVPTCTGNYYADPVLRTCALFCSANLFKYHGPTSNTCVQYCPDNLYAQNATTGVPSACVPKCTVLLSLPTTRTC